MNHFNKYKLSYLWAVFILLLCTVNPASLPDFDFSFRFGKDKLVHFILFGVQALLIVLANFGSNGTKHYLWSFFISSVYGIGIEIVQGLFFASRTFDFADMLANCMGAASVVAVFLLFKLVRSIQLS